VVPDPYNPFDWDRYSYIRNNPVRYNDPTGHRIDDSGGDIGGILHKEETDQQYSVKNKYKSDAKLISGTFTIGFGGFYIATGYDVVITNDEVGWFSTWAQGPGIDLGPASVISAENEDKTFVTPQVGVSFCIGDIYGGDVNLDVTEYKGTALVGGASFGAITHEEFSSVDPKTGNTDDTITGSTTGFTAGGTIPPFYEAHSYYSRATYEQTISKLLTQIFK
jgi:hypothetical protein